MRTIRLTKRRSAALISAAVLTTGGLVASMGAASAGITLGPSTRPDGLPNYIVDAQGLAVAPCDTGTAVCGGAFTPADPAYWDAGGDAGPIKLVYSVSSPAGGRIARFVGSGLAPGRYKIQDPWGSVFCSADAGGKMDCRKSGRRISTMLRQVPGRAGFVGGPGVNKRFTGSPTGFNKVVITGPGGFKASTSRLAISGMLKANTAMSSINKTALKLGTGRQAAPVTKTIRYESFGTANARPRVSKAGRTPGAFTVRNQCASQAPGSACNIAVTFAPKRFANSVKKAVLVIDDNGMAAPRKVALTGVGLRR